MRKEVIVFGEIGAAFGGEGGGGGGGGGAGQLSSGIGPK